MSTPAEQGTADSGGTGDLSYAALTFALMGGAAIWLVRLIVNSALVPYACRVGSAWSLWLATGLSTLVAVAALAYAWRFWRMADEDGRPVETARWLGALGVLFNVTSIVGIIAETVPVGVLDVCRPLGT